VVMERSPRWRWLILAAAILALFLGAVSMNMQKLQGWNFALLCAVAVLLGVGGYMWGRDRLLPVWEQLPRAKRVLLVVLTATAVLIGRLLANRHKPNEQFADLMAGIGVLIALALLGLYRTMSRGQRRQ